MADNPAVSVPQMNQETILAQEALRDETAQGYSDASAAHRHETRDADVKRIAWIGAGMAALGMSMFLFLWLLLGLFKRIPNSPDAPISPLALKPPTPVAPRIQDATPQNYQRFLRSEEETLNGSGPTPAEESAWQRETGTMAGSRGTSQTTAGSSLQPGGQSPNLYNPGPGVVGASGAQQPEGNRHIPLEQAKAALLRRGFDARPQNEPSPFPQNAPDAGRGKPESLPLGMQPTGTYRADVGPTGKNP